MRIRQSVGGVILPKEFQSFIESILACDTQDALWKVVSDHGPLNFDEPVCTTLPLVLSIFIS